MIIDYARVYRKHANSYRPSGSARTTYNVSRGGGVVPDDGRGEAATKPLPRVVIFSLPVTTITAAAAAASALGGKKDIHTYNI